MTGFARVDSFARTNDARRLVAVAIHDQGETIVWSGVREQSDEVTVFVLLYPAHQVLAFFSRPSPRCPR